MRPDRLSAEIADIFRRWRAGKFRNDGDLGILPMKGSATASPGLAAMRMARFGGVARFRQAAAYISILAPSSAIWYAVSTFS